jgi:hypothetical protein
MNVYKEALKANIRFSTARGLVALSDLFSLPLKATNRNAISLDGLYSELMQIKSSYNNNSYLGSVDDKALVEVDLKLALLKDVMDTKIAELNTASTKADLEAKRKALLAEMATRVQAAPAKLTDEQLAAALADVDKELT